MTGIGGNGDARLDPLPPERPAAAADPAALADVRCPAVAAVTEHRSYTEETHHENGGEQHL